MRKRNAKSEASRTGAPDRTGDEEKLLALIQRNSIKDVSPIRSSGTSIVKEIVALVAAGSLMTAAYFYSLITGTKA